MEPGHICYLEYVGYPGLFHARLLLSRVEADDWVILTPDRDLYTETWLQGTSISVVFITSPMVHYPQGYRQLRYTVSGR